MLSFILVQPKPDVTVATLVARLRQLDGLAAFSSDELSAQTIGWYIKNTGIAISFGTVVLSASWWAWPSRGRPSTSSSMKNVRFMAALKAMGAPTRTLAQMVLLQALTVGLVGYGLGVGLTAIFSNAVLKGGEPPFFSPWQVLAFASAVVVFICCFSATIGLLKIIRAEPAIVFR